MDQFPDDPKKIKARIKSYERSLRKELAISSFIGDGYGKRYLLGPLYMLLGDVEGAIKSYEWFENNYPDDIGEPLQYITWTLALYRNGDMQAASDKLIQTMLMNLYMVPYMIGPKPKELDIWHGSNYAELEYIEYLPVEVFHLWHFEELDWARKLYHSPRFEKIRDRYIEIHKELKTEEPGKRRSELVNESSRMAHLDFSE